MSVPGFPSVTPFILSQGEKGGCFNICLYLALPLSLHSSYGKVKRGVVLTYVSSWLSLCLHSSYRRVKREGGFNICLYLAFPLSLHSSYHRVQNTVVSESVELLLNRSF